MTQLTPDALAIGHALMRLDAAQAAIRARVAPIQRVETVALAAAEGRVLAGDLVAPLDLPPFANSAVDGYAVRFDDLPASGPATFLVSGRAAAGRALEGEARSGAALRVFTGAATPEGFDTVFMQEDVTTLEDGRVVLPTGLKRFANRRPAGEDVACGDVAIPAGARLRPQEIALAAALGVATLEVRARPRVGVFSTGDELAGEGPLRAGAIHDANRPALLALVARAGGEPIDLGALPDDPARIAPALAQAAARCDLLLTSGGVSMGEEDHVRGAIEKAGALVFWRVGLKPGRPVAMGLVGGVPLMGLPGNPAAVFVTFFALARPMIGALAGETWRAPTPMRVASGFAYKKKEGRREFVRAALVARAGAMVAEKFPGEGAGLITSLTRSDGFVILPEDMTRLAEGETVDFVPYSSLY
jgi:molybdopterin molybdotransferase